MRTRFVVSGRRELRTGFPPAAGRNERDAARQCTLIVLYHDSWYGYWSISLLCFFRLLILILLSRTSLFHVSLVFLVSGLFSYLDSALFR